MWSEEVPKETTKAQCNKSQYLTSISQRVLIARLHQLQRIKPLIFPLRLPLPTPPHSSTPEEPEAAEQVGDEVQKGE